MIAIDTVLWVWFVLALASAAFVAYDLLTRTPAMTVMKWGWVLVVFYTGIFGLVVYLLTCREPLAGTHREYVAPLWKQAVGSTIHCVAGDATGIIAGAALAFFLHLSRVVDLAVEYVAGFSFGLLIFQALFMKLMTGDSYAAAVRRTILPEWVSMNTLMAGMIPVMLALMARDPSAMSPIGPHFWGVMSLAILIGAATAYPVNVWLVSGGLKHGMGTVEVLGRGGHSVEVEREFMTRRARRARKHVPGADEATPAGETPLTPSEEGRASLGPGLGERIVVSLATVGVLVVGVWIGFRLAGPSP